MATPGSGGGSLAKKKNLQISWYFFTVICRFEMKPQSYFYVSAVAEPQPKVEQVEQKQVLPEPGELCYALTDNINNMITSQQRYYVTLPSRPTHVIEYIAETHGRACVWYANASQKERKGPFGLVLSSQVHIKCF